MATTIRRATGGGARPHAPDTASPFERYRDYRRMEAALEWLAGHFDRQPDVAEAAARAGLSETHFRRLFRRWVGVGPKRFVEVLTLEQAKRRLDESASVLEAALDAGLSGPGRLHDLFVSLEAMTPGEYRRRGEGLEIGWGFGPSPFGECLLLHTDRGICGLAFTDGERDREAALASLRRGLERARLRPAPAATATLLERIFARPEPDAEPPLRVLVRGTEFQVRVWRALLEIPAGALVSYEALARRVGRPGAVRAAARANAGNAVSYLIPCHRVIRKSGLIGGYRWGPQRKLALLSAEAAAAAGG